MKNDNSKKTRKFTKKDALIDAAIKEFGQNRFQNASLNTILKEANLSKGVFYHHFSNKDELYLAVVGLLFEKKKAFIQQHLGEDDLRGDIFHILKRSLVLSLQFAAQNPEIGRFSNRLLQERGQPIFDAVMKQYNIDNDAYVQNMVLQAIQNGNIRSDIPEAFTIHLIKFLLNHINEILDTQDLDDYEGKAHVLFSVLESGLRARGSE